MTGTFQFNVLPFRYNFGTFLKIWSFVFQLIIQLFYNYDHTRPCYCFMPILLYTRQHVELERSSHVLLRTYYHVRLISSQSLLKMRASQIKINKYRFIFYITHNTWQFVILTWYNTSIKIGRVIFKVFLLAQT
jgi:hypothetical protein